MPTETKVWKAIGGGGGYSKAKDTTTINIDSLQLKIVDVGNDDDDNDNDSGEEDSDDELGALIYNSSNTAKKCREEATKEDTVSIATTQAAEVGGGGERTHDVSTFDDMMTSDVMDSRLNYDNTSIATSKLQYYTNNSNDTDIDVSAHAVQKKKKQRYANEEIVKQLLAERELKRMYDMKNNKQLSSSAEEVVVGMDMKSRDGQVSGDEDTKQQEKKKDTVAADQSPTPLVDPQEEPEKKNSSTSISEYVTAMNSIESMLSNQMKKEKERRMVGPSHEQSKKEEDVQQQRQKSVSEALPSAPPRDFDWVSHYRQYHDKNTNKVTLPATGKAKKQKKTAKEPPVIVTKRNYQQMGYHNYEIKDVKALKQMSTVVIPQPRPTRPQVNGRDWRSHQHLLRHHPPTHRQRTPYSQRYHPPTLHKASPPPYQPPTRVHKKHTSPKYKTKRPPGRPKHGVSERKMLRGPPPVVHNGSPWGRSKIDSREDVVVDTRDDIEEDSRAGPSGLVMDQRIKEVRDIKKGRRRVGALAKAKAQALAKERKRHEEVIYVYDADGRRITGQVAKAKAQVLAKQRNQREVDHETEELKQTLTMDREGKINLECRKEDERYSMEAERLVKRAKQCEKGNDEEQIRRVKELLEMTDDIKNLGKERDREEEQIRYVQMLAARELQRRQVIESRMNWI